MKFLNYNTTSFLTTTRSEFNDVVGDAIKKMTYYNGDTDFVDFNARQTATGIVSVVQLNFTDYQNLINFFNANVGNDITIELASGEFPFGPNVTGILTASLTEAIPEGEQAFAEDGNFSIQLKLSYIDNPDVQPDFDFLIECEISAWSVDQKLASGQSFPTGTPVGWTIFTAGGGNLPLAVHLGGESWSPVFSKKQYETKYWLTNLTIGPPTFQGQNNLDDAYITQSNQYFVWDGSVWNNTPFPPIDTFKPVILNSDIQGLKNSKFYWSTFTDLAIDNSDPTDLLPTNYQSGIIEKSGIKFPKWSIGLEKGPSIERMMGFSFALQNADRKNILTNEINFFGSWCVLKVWDKSQNKSVTIRSGLNRTSGFSFSNFKFEVEPKTWNDSDKTIPSRSMATLLGADDLGTTTTEDYIPQTFGSWDYAKTKVKFKNVGALEIGGRITHNIIEQPVFDAVTQTIDIVVRIDWTQWKPASTQFVKASGSDVAFQIVGWSFRTPTSTTPNGSALIRFKSPISNFSLFDVSKSVGIVENKFQLITDDRPNRGFGSTLNVLTYDSDSNEYLNVPQGTFVVLDNQTIALGNDPTSFLLDDDFNLFFGSPTFAENNQFSHSNDYQINPYQGNNDLFVQQRDGHEIVNSSSIVYNYGNSPFNQSAKRDFITYGSENFYNLPNDGTYTAPDILLIQHPGIGKNLAFIFACKYLEQSSNTHIWSKVTTGLIRGLLFPSRGYYDETPLSKTPNRGKATDLQNQPNNPDGFYYHELNGGRLSIYWMTSATYDPNNFNPLVTPRNQKLQIGNGEKPFLMSQRFPITQAVKDSLRGSKSVRLLGSLFYSFAMVHSQEISRDKPSSITTAFADLSVGVYANIRIIGTLKNDDVANDRIVIDKTFNVSDDTSEFTTRGSYRQSSVWGQSDSNHIIYNLPDSMGGNTERYYGEDETAQSDYVRLVIKRSRNLDGDPILGATMRDSNLITTAGTIVGFSGDIFGGNKILDWVEVLVQMNDNTTGNFSVGMTLTSVGFSGELMSPPTPDVWRCGRDLFKLDDLDVADLFSDSDFLFGDYDNLDFTIIPFYTSGQRLDYDIRMKIGFGNPYDNNVTEYQGIFWESASELDLGNAENVFVECQGRLDSDENFMESPDDIFEHQLSQIDNSSEIVLHPSANQSGWKSRDQLIDEHTLSDLMSEYVKHIFGVITFGDDGEYVVRSLDYLDHGIQPTDFKATFDSSNIIRGSLGEIQYRDLDSIHSDFEFNFDFSPGKGETNRVATLNWNTTTNSLDISGFGGDNDSPRLQGLKTSLIESLNSQLGEQFRVSRQFYNTGVISKKIVDLPLFYDSELWVTDNVFPISTLAKSISKWVRFYLFNSWTIKFQTKMDVVISDGLRLGDLVTFDFNSITGDEKLFAFVRSIKPKLYDGIVEIELFASVDPWVYSTFYDRVWDAGLISDTYNPDQFKHSEFFKYPFKDTNQIGTFSDNGDLNQSGYDPNNFKFTDDSVADPDEAFNPLP